MHFKSKTEISEYLGVSKQTITNRLRANAMHITKTDGYFNLSIDELERLSRSGRIGALYKTKFHHGNDIVKRLEREQAERDKAYDSRYKTVVKFKKYLYA